MSKEILIITLSNTTPYNRPLDFFQYKRIDGTIISLMALIDSELEESNKPTAEQIYEAIGLAMVDYLIPYPAAYAFKKHTAKKFMEWLKRIAEELNLEVDYPPELEEMAQDDDVACAMVKLLHARDGITKEELSAKLNITTREVQKNLRKIDSLLSQREEGETVKGFRIGGAPVQVPVEEFKKRHDRKTYYVTPNTMHPIVLMENVMQVNALLKSLCEGYYSLGLSINLTIAVDIWYQLSDYAKGRIRYLNRGKEFMDFMDEMEEAMPDEHQLSFVSERELYERGNMALEDTIMLLVKSGNRRCNISLRIDKHAVQYKSARIELGNQLDTYFLKTEAKESICFTMEQVIDLELI